MRIEKEVANTIYGTLNIPVLNHKDPVTAKLIRNSHWITGDISRGVHNLTKTTLANLVKGEVAAHWNGQYKQVKKIIQECEVCRPNLGRSLFRCRVGAPPFQHISLDPLGAIRVLMTGSHSGKLSPLIMYILPCSASSIGMAHR